MARDRPANCFGNRPRQILELSQELTRAIDEQMPSLSKIGPGQREILVEPEGLTLPIWTECVFSLPVRYGKEIVQLSTVSSHIQT